MKVTTTTRSKRIYSRPLVSDTPTILSSSVTEVTVSVPFLVEMKDMFLTFNEQELRDMLRHIEDKQKFIKQSLV